jgi:hypothetical protein
MQNSRGAAYRMAGKNLKQNTQKLFQSRNSQGLDSHMFILDGKIFIKYEAASEAKPDNNDGKKANASGVRTEADKKIEESSSDQTLCSQLIAFDASTLEPIQEIKLQTKPKEPAPK